MYQNRNSNWSKTSESEELVAFMVEKQDKNGKDYFSGTMSLGNGKLVRLTMFQQQKDGLKSTFVIKGTKMMKRESTRRSW